MDKLSGKDPRIPRGAKKGHRHADNGIAYAEFQCNHAQLNLHRQQRPIIQAASQSAAMYLLSARASPCQIGEDVNNDNQKAHNSAAIGGGRSAVHITAAKHSTHYSGIRRIPTGTWGGIREEL